MFSVESMCRVLRVHRSGYYCWLNKSKGVRALSNEHLDKQLYHQFELHKKRYGAPRLTHELRQQGIVCSKNRVARRMKLLQLSSLIKKKFRATPGKSSGNFAQNVLNRDFRATAINQKYVSDITYIATGTGWLYLAVVIDLYSRAVIGWAMQSSMTQQLIIDALMMALKRRGYPKGVLFHSDRGSQYCADDVQRLLSTYGMTISMSRQGNCWDNSVVESFFHSLKVELVYQERYSSLEEARSSIFSYIETYYNPIRRHSSTDYLAPLTFELRAHSVAQSCV